MLHSVDNQETETWEGARKLDYIIVQMFSQLGRDHRRKKKAKLNYLLLAYCFVTISKKLLHAKGE